MAEEHAECDEEVGDDFGVRGQDIGQEDVAEFAIVREGEAAEADAFQGVQEAAPAGGREARDREEEYEEDIDEEGYREEVVVDDERGRAVGERPEKEERDREGEGEDQREAVGRQVMGRFGALKARGIVN